MERSQLFSDTLYQDLTALVAHRFQDKTKFVSKDFPVVPSAQYLYRIFTYSSLPKYSDFFLHPNALNCRGTMFLVDTVSDHARLIALPMQKFFNYGEGPDGQRFQFTNALRAFMKVDGSLLTSYICPFEHTLKFKSRNMPTYQNYAVVDRSMSDQLKAELTELTSSNVSVDLELTTPENAIIIEYKDYAVHVLKARSTITGDYVDIRSSEFAARYPKIAAHLVKEIPNSQVDIRCKDIEGYVLDMPNGRMVKFKTLPYLSTASALNALQQSHRTKDKSKMAAYLYKAATDGVLDRVRSLYYQWAVQSQKQDFPLAQLLDQLIKVENFALETMGELRHTIESFYQENKHLKKADYARKAKAEPKYGPLLRALMHKYCVGRDINYQKLAVKLYGHEAPIDTIVEPSVAHSSA